MSAGDQRRFTREFKVAAVERIGAGENVSALSRELGVARKCLYQWLERYRLGGAVALRSRGRMTKAEVLAMRSMREAGRPLASGAGKSRDPAVSGPASAGDELARARARITELERKIGQQEVDLDFFQRALQQVGGTRRRRGAPGGTTSTRSSKE